MAKPGPDRVAADEDILRVLVMAYEPALGTADIGNAFDVSREAAENWLNDLYDRGLVQKGFAGPARIWWPTDEGRRYLAESSSSHSQ